MFWPVHRFRTAAAAIAATAAREVGPGPPDSSARAAAAAAQATTAARAARGSMLQQQSKLAAGAAGAPAPFSFSCGTHGNDVGRTLRWSCSAPSCMRLVHASCMPASTAQQASSSTQRGHPAPLHTYLKQEGAARALLSQPRQPAAQQQPYQQLRPCQQVQAGGCGGRAQVSSALCCSKRVRMWQPASNRLHPAGPCQHGISTRGAAGSEQGVAHGAVVPSQQHGCHEQVGQEMLPVRAGGVRQEGCYETKVNGDCSLQADLKNHSEIACLYARHFPCV